MFANTNIAQDSGLCRKGQRRFVKMNKNNNKKGQECRFKLRISSDVGDAVRLVNDSRRGIPKGSRIRLSETDSFMKKVRIMLVAGKDDRVAASCTAIFVNGGLLRRRGIVPSGVLVELLPSEGFFLSVSHDYVTEGINFVQLTDIYVLPEYQGIGLAEWITSEAPELLSEFFGFSFSYVIVPFEPSLFKSEAKVLGNDKDATDAFLRKRRAVMASILGKLGYRPQATDGTTVFFKEM